MYVMARANVNIALQSSAAKKIKVKTNGYANLAWLVCMILLFYHRPLQWI